MRIRVGKPEVDEFDIVAVVGQHDVGRLEVPVDNLLGMHIGQRVTCLIDDL